MLLLVQVIETEVLIQVVLVICSSVHVFVTRSVLGALRLPPLVVKKLLY